MEELTIDELIANEKRRAENCRGNYNHYAKLKAEEHEQIIKKLTKLAYYEGLEEQDRLIELPCKVGYTVYEITGATTRGYNWKYLTYENAYIHETVFNLSRFTDIGKTVFLTKEEAERKLEELKSTDIKDLERG